MLVNSNESYQLAKIILTKFSAEPKHFLPYIGKIPTYDDIIDAMFAVQWITSNRDEHPNSFGKTDLTVASIWRRVPRKHGNVGEFNVPKCMAVLRYGMEIAPLVGVDNSYEFYCRRIPISRVKQLIEWGLDIELLMTVITAEPRPPEYGAAGYIRYGDENSKYLAWDI